MKTKKLLTAVTVGTVAALAVGVVAYSTCHKPNLVKNPVWRSTHRADGRPKVAFDSPTRANWQSVKQLALHGEVCPAYQVGNKFYTGHSRSTWIKSINPIKVA